jgi:hypothetical protein
MPNKHIICPYITPSETNGNKLRNFMAMCDCHIGFLSYSIGLQNNEGSIFKDVWDLPYALLVADTDSSLGQWIAKVQEYPDVFRYMHQMAEEDFENRE